MEKNKLTPNEMLDKVLEWFSMEIDEMGTGEQLISREWIKEQDASRLMVDKFRELNTTDFLYYKDMIYRKLAKDGYLEVENKVIYSITFEGKMFSKNGGYIKQHELNEASESRKDFREKMLLWGTWAVAFGAIALVIWEMYKTFCLEKHGQ